MKLQYMTVIFAIIIIPITLLLSIYIQSQTDSMTLQTKYDTMLVDATYDAVIAFQSNTLNNENSTNKDTLRQNIAASINVFSNSLSNNLGVGGYSKDYLMPYVPAIAYTMYDGFYIYSPIENLKTEKDENGNVINKDLEYEHVLKPYIYYSERLVKDDIDVIVNYSLDNYITVYGKIGEEIVSKSGYLAEIADNSSDTGIFVSGEEIYYNGKPIEVESLSENICFITNEEKKVEQCQFFYDINHEKVYKNNTGNSFFKIADYKKQGIDTVNQEVVEGAQVKIREHYSSTYFPSDQSARVYYLEAYEFTKWINDNIGNEFEFLKIDENNNPENEASSFVQHKRDVIKSCIEENLNNAISSYNSQSGKEYNFKMPKLKDEDWEQIYRNVSIISFLQGIPAGIREYNNYSVVASTGNKEYIDTKSIYFIGADNCYHVLNCDKLENDNLIVGYKSVDFNKYRKYYNSSDYYYRHSYRGTDVMNTYIQACYHCIVDSGQTKPLDLNDEAISEKVQCYYEAIGRERYNLIKTTQNLK